MPNTRIMLQVTSAFLGMFREKNVPKTAKIEYYNTRFRTFSWPEIRTAQGAFYGRGMSLERSHVAWNEYMDVFTFILRQL